MDLMYKILNGNLKVVVLTVYVGLYSPIQDPGRGANVNEQRLLVLLQRARTAEL